MFVDPAAVLPDLTLVAGEDPQPSELEHGLGKPISIVRVIGEFSDKPLGAGVVSHPLIKIDDSLVGDDGLVEVGVKGVSAPRGLVEECVFLSAVFISRARLDELLE